MLGKSESVITIIAIHGAGYDTTDPRDHIYALLNIFYMKLILDYSKSVTSVYIDTVEYFHLEIGSLEF
jgi:hypothetical protein